MNCQLQVLTSEEPFQFSFISMLQGVYPRDDNDLPAYLNTFQFTLPGIKIKTVLIKFKKTNIQILIAFLSKGVRVKKDR